MVIFAPKCGRRLFFILHKSFFVFVFDLAEPLVFIIFPPICIRLHQIDAVFSILAAVINASNRQILIDLQLASFHANKDRYIDAI